MYVNESCTPHTLSEDNIVSLLCIILHPKRRPPYYASSCAEDIYFIASLLKRTDQNYVGFPSIYSDVYDRIPKGENGGLLLHD